MEGNFCLGFYDSQIQAGKKCLCCFGWKWGRCLSWTYGCYLWVYC